MNSCSYFMYRSEDGMMNFVSFLSGDPSAKCLDYTIQALSRLLTISDSLPLFMFPFSSNGSD